jgi:hypothetical protein
LGFGSATGTDDRDPERELVGRVEGADKSHSFKFSMDSEIKRGRRELTTL